MAAVDRERVRLLSAGVALAPAAGLAVWTLTRWQSLGERGRIGAVVLLLLAEGAAVGLLACRPRTFVLPRAVALGGLALTLTIVGVGVAGSPSNPLGEHRPYYWRVATNQVAGHPWLGSGAGTFALHWREEQPIPFGALDAHNLYLETLAELGPAGLVLLLSALAAPLVAGARSRARPLVPAALASYVAFLLHAGLDWDWEMPVVTMTGLLCATGLLVAAREPAVRLGAGLRAVTLAALTAIAAVGFL